MRKKTFETIPRNVGGSRDFNRIEIEGLPPDAIEGAMSSLEGELDQVLGQMIEEKELPTGDDFVLLMNFVALMSVRNPRMRASWARFQSDVSERVVDIALSSEDRWLRHLERMRDEGVDVADVSYERMKAFHEEKCYDFIVPNESHIKLEVDVLSSVIPCLMDRKWTLFVAAGGVESFIVSDHPVALYWNDGKRHRYPPGHGLANTEVTFPISRSLMISGVFEGVGEVVAADSYHVAMANSIALSFAEQQIYSASQTPCYFRPGGFEIGRGSQVFQDYRRPRD